MSETKLNENDDVVMNPEVQDSNSESTKIVTDDKLPLEESKDKEILDTKDNTESTTYEKQKNNDEFFDLTTIVPV